MNKEIIKNTLILICITLIAGLALGAVYEITKDPIAKQEQKTREEALKKVFASADSFDDKNKLDVSNSSEVLGKDYEACTIEEAVPALDKNENCIGYVVTVSCSEGYGGEITLMAGINQNGTLNGIEFLTLNETAGLGMNAKEPEFKKRFQDKQPGELSVTKEEHPADNEIQAISSATITSNAVVKAVNAGEAYISFVRGAGSEGGEKNE